MSNLGVGLKPTDGLTIPDADARPGMVHGNNLEDAVTELIRFTTAQGNEVLAEVDEGDPGYERISRQSHDVVAKAARHIDAAFVEIRIAADALIDEMSRVASSPHDIEVEFGIKLNAEVGAVIARSQAEGHFQVNLKWSKSSE
jgi:hypothetical protein